MNIGIDIDDTINKLSETLLKYGIQFNKENGIEYDIKNSEYDFHKAFGWNDEQEAAFKEKYIAKCLIEANIKEGAREYIHKLKEEGNKIVIITARNNKETCPNVYNISNEWLIKHGIEMDKLETGCTQKTDKCKEHKIDIFIDDNKDHCREVKEGLGIPVIMFDSIYNQGINDFDRVYSWEEVYNTIKAYEAKKSE